MLTVVMPFPVVIQNRFSVRGVFVIEFAEFPEHMSESAFQRMEKFMAMVIPLIGKPEISCVM
jgi:hypothetical protein